MQSLTDEERVRFGFDERFEDRWWKTEKTAWVLMIVLLLAGVAGVFGRGPLVRARTESAGVAVEYDRILHYETPSRVTVTVPASESGIRLFVNKALLDQFGSTGTRPQATASIPREDGAILVFPPAANDGRIQLLTEPATIGAPTLAVGLEGHPPAAFRVAVLP